MVLVRDSEDKKETLVRDSEDKKETLVSYNDLFYKEGVPQKKTILLGEPGAGKTTFLKHLTDVWCNPTSKRQFDDVDVFQEYPFLFHISCRFAGKNETILDMIKHQLFDDEEMKDIACNVLKHFSNDCLILIDGFDELQRSALAETGKRGDITGLPSLIGVQNCVLIITSRPWKFFSIPKDEQEKFSRMELDGIKDVKELVEILFCKHQVPDPVKTSSAFLAEIKERKMKKLIKYPLMLIFAIDVWVQNMSLPKSVCLCYINMIKLSIERSQTKCEKANMDNTNIVENLLKSSKSEESLPHVFSNFKCVQRHAGLFLSLGHLASDFLLGLKEQMLVFQKDDCEKYKISEDDRSLRLCLDLGILTKLESTVRGIKQKETFQFCHKTFQEFFAALWLSRKYTIENSQEKLNLHACMETDEDLLNHSVLLNFLCGFNPEAGTHFWTYIAQKTNDLPDHYISILLCSDPKTLMIQSIQNLVLNTVKEAHDCCDHQGERAYYCVPHVRIDHHTSDEDVSPLVKMIIQNNSAYLKSLEMTNDICLLSSQYHSLLCCISSATNLSFLYLGSISCQTHGSSDRLPVLDLHKHHKLRYLDLDNIPLSCLLLPNQEETQLHKLCLAKLSMSHDNLVQLCKSLTFLSGLNELYIGNLSCSDHDGSCPLSVLGLQRHHKLEELKLGNTSISGLLLPGREESQIRYLCLYNLVLSHDSLVQLCSSISSSSVLRRLKLTNLRCYDHDDLTNLSCSEHSGRCPLPALGLQRHHKLEWLELDNASISGLLLPGQEESRIKELDLHNLVLSHDSLVQLCSSISSSSALRQLKLTNLRCYDHDDRCGIPIVDRPKAELENVPMEQIPVEDLSALSGLENLQLTMVPCSEHSVRCNFTVLDLHKHHRLEELELDTSSISGIILPRPERHIIDEICLRKLVLSHYSLQQLCTSLPDLSDDCAVLQLTNLSCSDHSGSCFFPLLSLHDT